MIAGVVMGKTRCITSSSIAHGFLSLNYSRRYKCKFPPVLARLLFTKLYLDLLLFAIACRMIGYGYCHQSRPPFLFTHNDSQLNVPFPQSTWERRIAGHDSGCAHPYTSVYIAYTDAGHVRNKSRLRFWIWGCSSSDASRQSNCCREKVPCQCNLSCPPIFVSW